MIENGKRSLREKREESVGVSGSKWKEPKADLECDHVGKNDYAQSTPPQIAVVSLSNQIDEK
jgi:hypothetical protein